MNWISTDGHVSNVFEFSRPDKDLVRLVSKAYDLSTKLESPTFRLTPLLLTFGGSEAAIHCGGDAIFLRNVTVDGLTIWLGELI